MKIKNFILALISATFSFPALADNMQLVSCKNFPAAIVSEIKDQINSYDQKFQWNVPQCQIVETRSIFPRKNDKGTIQFEKGVQLFIYQNKQLKFICLPGWICKSWQN